MTRLGTVFWLVLVLAAGFTTFRVKYAVQDIEDELNRVRKQTIAERQEIRVLTAEWTYLNQPERLAELNRRFLGLAPMSAKQLQRSIAEIPLRPAAAPPDALVEANSGPAAPQTPAGGPAIAPTALGPAPAVAEVAGQPDGSGRRVQRLQPPGEAAPVQLAKVVPGQSPGSLDALIAQIAETP